MKRSSNGQPSYTDTWKKCKHPKLVLVPKYVCCERKFICQSCNKSSSHQLNVVRHVKTCKGIKVLHKCEVCSREFKFRSLPEKHLSSHKDRNLQCNICNRTFTTQDRFTTYIQPCTTDDQIVPNFVEKHELFQACSTIDISDTKV